jgi:rhamnogalacturonyl hydrolase YesR
MVEKVKSALLAMQRYSWEQGVCAQAFMESGDDDVVIQLCYEAVNRQIGDGRLASIGDQHGVTDPIAIIPALVRAIELTGDPALQNGLDKAWDWILNAAPRNGKGIIYHVDDSPQYWVDCMYMLPPSLLAGGYMDEAVKQADGHIDMRWDAGKKLFHHVWDDGKKEFMNPACWGVGNGWAIAGLTRLIEALPDGKDKVRYISVVRQTVTAALAYCDSGLFHYYLDEPDTFIEVNFAQMLCYTIAKGVKQGWLPEKLLEDAKAIRQTVQKYVTPYGFVTQVCGAPSFDKPGMAPEGQAFYILMETAWKKL